MLDRPFVLATPDEATGPTDFLLRTLSIHPNACPPGAGTLGTFTPAEVPRPCPPQTKCQTIFQIHSVSPKP